MKKLFLVLCSVLTFSANAQELTGCMGISFGESKEKVRSAMDSKPGFEFNKEVPGVGFSYLNGTFAGRDCIGAVFQFHNNQLHTLKVLVNVETQSAVMDLYYSIVAELKEKYGVTPEYFHKYRYPYAANDGHTVTAIKLGYADIECLFTFPDSRYISVAVTKSISINLTYQDGVLAAPALNEVDQTNKKDY